MRFAHDWRAEVFAPQAVAWVHVLDVGLVTPSGPWCVESFVELAARVPVVGAERLARCCSVVTLAGWVAVLEVMLFVACILQVAVQVRVPSMEGTELFWSEKCVLRSHRWLPVELQRVALLGLCDMFQRIATNCVEWAALVEPATWFSSIHSRVWIHVEMAKFPALLASLVNAAALVAESLTAGFDPSPVDAVVLTATLAVHWFCTCSAGIECGYVATVSDPGWNGLVVVVVAAVFQVLAIVQGSVADYEGSAVVEGSVVVV